MKTSKTIDVFKCDCCGKEDLTILKTCSKCGLDMCGDCSYLEVLTIRPFTSSSFTLCTTATLGFSDNNKVIYSKNICFTCADKLKAP